jgi:hypothetical protein
VNKLHKQHNLVQFFQTLLTDGNVIDIRSSMSKGSSAGRQHLISYQKIVSSPAFCHNAGYLSRRSIPVRFRKSMGKGAEVGQSIHTAKSGNVSVGRRKCQKAEKSVRMKTSPVACSRPI